MRNVFGLFYDISLLDSKTVKILYIFKGNYIQRLQYSRDLGIFIKSIRWKWAITWSIILVIVNRRFPIRYRIQICIRRMEKKRLIGLRDHKIHYQFTKKFTSNDNVINQCFIFTKRLIILISLWEWKGLKTIILGILFWRCYGFGC